MLNRRIRSLMQAIRQWREVPRFGFVQGHGYLTPADLLGIGKFVGIDDAALTERFENGFAGLIGEGRAVSFAAGRMGFFALMKQLDIKAGDEVVLQGATCSVMANAVMRTGARPIYADIDPETFGSSASAIREVLTPRTRMIVAQHSFGIPCSIRPIIDLARERNIFVVEDCALTVGSTIDGVGCGNFGDAAIFSTDHSKPFNTMSGGLVYTRNPALYGSLKALQGASGSFSAEKQRALWQQLLFERKYCRPDRYGRMRLISLFRSNLGIAGHAFADEDFGSTFSSSYPYPARLPSFLAAVGIQEIDRWPETVRQRKALLKRLVKIFEDQYGEDLPSVYRDPSRDIVPLRLAWSSMNVESVRGQLARILDNSWIWFMQPVVACTEPLENFGYQTGQCPVSEEVGPNMVNIPCNIGPEWGNVLVGAIRKCAGVIVE